jgi:hypothetical protein
MRGFAQTFSADEGHGRDLEDDRLRSRIRVAIARFRFRPAQENSRFRFRNGAANNSTGRSYAIRRHATEEVPLPAKAHLRKANRPHMAAGSGCWRRTGRDQ